MTQYTYIANRVLDKNGIADGASIYFYKSGTTTLIDIFSDETYSTPLPNPIVLDMGAPVPNVYWNEVSVRVLIISREGEVVSDDDPYSPFGVEALGEPSGSAIVGYQYPAADAVVRTVFDKLSETVSVKDFGAVGDGVTDDTEALAKARAYIADTGVNLVFPSGIYLYTESPNWAIGDAVITADGDVTLRYTAGAGSAVVLDGEASDAVNPGSEGVYGVRMTGFKVESEQYSGVPVFIRAMHECPALGFRVMGGNPTLPGIRIEFCVSTDFYLSVSANATGAWYLNGRPDVGIYLANNGNPSKPVSYCNFHNPQVAGTILGMRMVHALGCRLVDGALQGCVDTGLYMEVGATLNKVRGMDLEVNNVDIVCIGLNNSFDDVDTEKMLRINAGANNRIIGGTHASIDITSGSVGNSIEGVRYARPNPNGTPSGGVITDAGLRTLRKNNLDMVTQRFDDDLLTETALTVGTGPFFTYVNTAAQAVSLLVTGGTVSTIDYAPQNVVTRLTGQTIGMFRLRPGDALVVTFSAAPTIYLYRE